MPRLVGLLNRMQRIGTCAGRSSGVRLGRIQAASPLVFWWLDPATVYAFGLILIASVYIGFADADGRWLRALVTDPFSTRRYRSRRVPK